MTKRCCLVFAVLFLFLTACANQENQEINSQTNEMSTLQAKSSTTEQGIAERAEREVLAFEEVVDVVAINNNDQLLVGFKIKQFSKLRTKEIEGKINKKLKKEFPNYETTASSDLKIFLETEKVKKQLSTNITKQKDVDKRMSKIIKLSKEQT
jgi:tRNA U54 and U55 pseudouridine synthase Pus10